MNGGQDGQKTDLNAAYEVWADLVEAGRTEPTFRPTKRYISQKDLIKGIKNIDGLANEWLAKAEKEGIIISNPDAGVGKSKYVLAG
jgi:hypothetical protein